MIELRKDINPKQKTSDKLAEFQSQIDAFGNYKARLFQYVSNKKQGVPQLKLQKMIEGIQKEDHPTVWKEMQRYHREGILNHIDNELETFL